MALLDPAATAGLDMAWVLREVSSAAAGVQHAGVVSVRNAGRVDQGFMVVEEDAGPTLDVAIAYGPLPAEQVRDLALDLSDALAAAHRAGVFHGAITPADVHLSLDGGPARLGGFGPARALALARRSGARAPICGDPSFLAPEQLAGELGGAAADRWALGAVTFLALTGRLPFGPDGWVEGNRLAFPRRVPPALRRMITELLDPDPALRPGEDAVRELLSPTTPADERSVPRFPPWAKAALAACALLALMGVTIVVRSAAQAPPSTAATAATVPDVVGAPTDTATDLLAAAGLSWTVRTMSSTEREAGTILSQEPAAGTNLAGGGEVTLVVSLGADQVEVPTVIGLTQRGAEVRLQAEGLNWRIVEQPNPGVGPGEVFEQEPQAGALVARRTEVEVVATPKAGTP